MFTMDFVFATPQKAEFQSGRINIRIQSGITIEQVREQLRASTIPKLGDAHFLSLLPDGLRLHSNQDQSSRLYVSPVHEQLNRTYSLAFSDSLSVFNVVKLIKSECSFILLA
jgi:hypothetical protein